MYNDITTLNEYHNSCEILEVLFCNILNKRVIAGLTHVLIEANFVDMVHVSHSKLTNIVLFLDIVLSLCNNVLN